MSDKRAPSGGLLGANLKLAVGDLLNHLGAVEIKTLGKRSKSRLSLLAHNLVTQVNRRRDNALHGKHLIARSRKANREQGLYIS